MHNPVKMWKYRKYWKYRKVYRHRWEIVAAVSGVAAAGLSWAAYRNWCSGSRA